MMISRCALALAISALTIERLRLMDRIDRVSDEIEQDEHLSETVLDIDRVLGEFASAYNYALQQEGGGYHFNEIIRNAEEEYRVDCDERYFTFKKPENMKYQLNL